MDQPVCAYCKSGNLSVRVPIVSIFTWLFHLQMQISMNQLRDENVAVKSALSMEQGNRGKAESLEREAEALRTQCGHLENQLKAAFQSNQELSNQIRSLQEHLRVLEERKMQEEQNLHTSYASQMQERESHLVGELKKTQELLSEGEKERITLRQQNANLQNTLRTSQETAKAFEDTKKNLDVSCLNFCFTHARVCHLISR